MAIGDTYRLSVRAVHGTTGEEYINVHHFRQENALVLDEAGEDLVGAWDDQVKPLLLPLMSNAILIADCEVRQIGDPSYIYEQAIADAIGSSSTDMLPPFVSPLVSWRTGLAGRSRRGRTYMFPTVEAHQVGGLLAPTYTGPWSDWADQMLQIGGGLEFAVWKLVIRSDVLNQSIPVTSYLLRLALARQSRRALGVGS